MTDAARYRALYSWLKRKYRADLPGLRQLAEEYAAGAVQPLNITSNNADGAGWSGQVSVEPALVLLACENLLAALDPAESDDAPAPVVADFSGCGT